MQHEPVLIRPAAAAGTFYPDQPAQLDTLLDSLLLNAEPDHKIPTAIIAPHAGYQYSGAVAATVYASLRNAANTIKRVLLLGPAHRIFVEGMALPKHTHFATPLGNISLDTQCLRELEQMPFVHYLNDAHADEHSLETQLPFLQKVLHDFTLIPIVVGKAKPETIAEVIEHCMQSDSTLIVVSSDLSHFHDYQTAVKIDRETTRLIESYEYEKIGPRQACGCMPLNGLLRYAKSHRLLLSTQDLRNSGDTADNKSRVVGYGAYALYADRLLDVDNHQLLLSLARESIAAGIKIGKPKAVDSSNYVAPLNNVYAVFVTLKLNGQLRGCIGTTEAMEPIVSAVSRYAYAAAFSDPRFPTVTVEELPGLDISLSILTPAQIMSFNDENDLRQQLRPGIDGLIIQKGNRKATFLPVVWETLNDAAQFLAQLKEKAGIGADEAPESAWRYQAECYS